VDRPIGDSAVAAARRQSLGDLLHRTALRRPHKPALIFGDRTWSYAQLDEVVNRTANALAVRGIAKGDRVALLGHNSDSYVVAFFALARLGAISVPINFMLNGDEVAFIPSIPRPRPSSSSRPWSRSLSTRSGSAHRLRCGWSSLTTIRSPGGSRFAT